MSLAVDNPILNNPVEEPREYQIYDKGQPKKMSGRRLAGYYFRTRKRSYAQIGLLRYNDAEEAIKDYFL